MEESWLRQKYEVEELTVREIGEVVGLHYTTVLYWMRKHGIRRRSTHRSKTLAIMSANNTGEGNPAWKGGRKTLKGGYVGIWMPSHPYVNHQGYVAEHRLVMENHLGRFLLPEEVVHHINGDKTDNRIENLALLDSQATHAAITPRFRNSQGQYAPGALENCLPSR